MVAKDGSSLLRNNELSALKDLCSLATIITPNIPEAEVLSDKIITDVRIMQDVAYELAFAYHTNVLIKGGHSNSDDCKDIVYLWETQKAVVITHPRIKTNNTHGTGCSLSAAIASYLAQQFDVESAVRKSIDYLHHAIEAGKQYQLGRGIGPVYHFYPQ